MMNKILEYKDKKIEYREKVGDFTIAKKGVMSQQYKKMNLTQEDIVLDIGAHIGAFTVSCFDKVKSVIAFEPEDECHDLLKRNILLNNMQNVIPLKFGVVGNTDLERKFYINTTKSFCSHSLFSNRNRKTEIVIKCLNINEVIKKYRPTAIKMNAEGVEYEILKAIKNFSKIKKLGVEFHFGCLRDRNHEKFHEIIGLVKQKFEAVDYQEKEKYWNNVHDFFCFNY